MYKAKKITDIIKSNRGCSGFWYVSAQRETGRIMIKSLKDSNMDNWNEVYESIILNSPNGIVIIDHEFRIVQCNETIEKMLGFSGEDVTGREISCILPGIDNRTDIMERDVFHYSTEDRILYIKKLMLQDQPEKQPVIILLIQDMDEITAVSDGTGSRADLSRQLRIVFERSFDGILVTDGKGNVLLVNDSYERITGIKKSEMIGRNMIELLNADWMKDSVVFPVIERKSPVSMTHMAKNGKSVIVTGVPVCDGEKVEMVIVNARDVSEMYELKEELMKSKEMEKLYFNQLKSNRKDDDSGGLVVVSPVMKEIYSLAKKVSSFNTNVLILGESGVGKEEVAKYVHENSRRRDKPFVVINCAAIPESLLESELFGYEKGAFTGAERDKEGLFETADSGTLFLDEIGDMPLFLQVKLLRFLETRAITRVGGTTPVTVDVRVLAATNKDLRTMMADGSFREDLYYRLNVIELRIPPLRQRVEDIGPLCLYFINDLNKRYGQNKKITYDVIKQLEQKPWIGNVRELKNTMERMIVMSNNEYLQIGDMTSGIPGGYEQEDLRTRIKVDGIIPINDAVSEVERQILQSALSKYKSTRKIAEALHTSQSTVVYKLRKHNLNEEPADGNDKEKTETEAKNRNDIR